MPMDTADNDMAMEAEPGATDSQLTLSPADYAFTKDWEDGQTYKLTIEVTQVAPGQFRVDTAAPSEIASEEEGPATEEEAGYEQPTNSNTYSNPAVAKMMAKR